MVLSGSSLARKGRDFGVPYWGVVVGRRWIVSVALIVVHKPDGNTPRHILSRHDDNPAMCPTNVRHAIRERRGNRKLACGPQGSRVCWYSSKRTLYSPATTHSKETFERKVVRKIADGVVGSAL